MESRQLIGEENDKLAGHLGKFGPVQICVFPRFRDDKAHDRTITGVKLVLEDGAELELPDGLTKLVFQVLKGTARGGLKTMTLPEELTSTVQANPGA